MKRSKNPDAQAYRDAAALIAEGRAGFCCNALEFSSENYFPGVGRPDLVESFKGTFEPRANAFAFWNAKSPESQNCRVLALLFMAEMVENP